MSVIASLVILIVLIARMLLKRAPKIFSYALWAVVLFRLLCPISFNLPISMLPNDITNADMMEQVFASYQNIRSDQKNNMTENDIANHINMDQLQDNSTSASDESYTSSNKAQIINTTVFSLLPYIWLTGIVVMLVYSVISMIRLRRNLVGNIPLPSEKNVFISDYIVSPFVVGIISPKIYLPSCLSEKELEYIILHEKHHIKRKDHWIKMIAFAALTIHWFNPLVWIAFVLASKDMEMSCDEAVLKELGSDISEAYSISLLNFAIGKGWISAAPLAFGEGDTKSRIVNILRWKKPAKWTLIISCILCVSVIMGCTVNKGAKDAGIRETYEKNEVSDVYEEWIIHTYYKMDNGIWKVEMEQEDGSVETRTYQYRIVLHGRIPTAAVDSNYILLSNRKDITFYQTYMASGFSSNMDDYFTADEAVFVSSWLGDLYTNHPNYDSDTIYVIEGETTGELTIVE